MTTDSKLSRHQNGSDDKETMAARLREAGLLENRLIPVRDGTKRSIVDHNKSKNRHSSVEKVSGNYGVYAGANPSRTEWLIDVDIDDYGESVDSESLEAVNNQPETLSIKSPHTDGDDGGHRYYKLITERSVEDFDVDDVLSGYINDGEPSELYKAAKDDPVALTLIEKFGVANPQPSWGELRVVNQYVVGPGSQLDGCDKEWCDECAKPDGGWYEIANDAPIATIKLEDVIDILRADGYTEDDQKEDTSDYTPDTDDDNRAERVVQQDSKIAEYLSLGAKAAGFRSDDGGGDRSDADLYTCCKMVEYGVPKEQARDLLNGSSFTKVNERGSKYWRETWNEALRKADKNSKSLPGDKSESGDIHQKFREACHACPIDPSRLRRVKTQDGSYWEGVEDILPDTSLDDAIFIFNRKAENLSGNDKQAVIGNVVLSDLWDRGDFFETPQGSLYYFDRDGTVTYRVDDDGNRILTEEFQGLLNGRYKILSGTFSRNLGKDIRTQARRDAPTKDVYRFAHYDETAGELYVTDWGEGYYAITPSRIEWRPNGSDVYFLVGDHAEQYQYLEPESRVSLGSDLPAELPRWHQSGDAIMRMFGNRANFDETAALGPAEQRKQLYLHLHCLPFIDVLIAKPIMGWIGEKGSGKTMIQRSVGKFIFGEEYTESTMPDAKDDFVAKVTNQPLAFIDNYDDGVDWANDMLASIATGAAIDKREYYTTSDLQREKPRCWLSLTSRDPPFRRDDVADRMLVFRVERINNNVVSENVYLNKPVNYRDTLWSEYLDNLQQVLSEYLRRDTASMTSDHRMADWAILAQIIADALGVEDVENLLETMQTERATFALENEEWAALVGEWVQKEPSEASKSRSASSLVDKLTEKADEYDRPMPLTSPQALGSKFAQYESELGELYNLDIDKSGSTNEYRFDVDDTTQMSGLDRYG